MTDGKSFWSSVPGVITGVASVVTAAVGLIGAGVTLGWFSSKDSHTDTSVSAAATTSTSTLDTTTTTLFGRTSGGTTATTASLSPLQATPTTLTFDALGARDQTVTVRNTTAASVSLRSPAIAGVDTSEFVAKDLTCGTHLDANRSCEVQVTYRATRAGNVTAKLVIEPTNAPAVEVPIKGSRLI